MAACDEALEMAASYFEYRLRTDTPTSKNYEMLDMMSVGAQAIRELQESRARVCETCEASYGHNRPYASSYVQCNQIWDAVAEDHQEVEKTHSCGLWEAKESKDE